MFAIHNSVTMMEWGSLQPRCNPVAMSPMIRGVVMSIMTTLITLH